MQCMRVGDLLGGGWIIKILFAVAIGDAVILDPGEFSQRRIRARPEMFEGELEADVAIKFPVRRIAGISFDCAPDLPARIAIPSKSRRSSLGEARRVNRAARPRIRQ